MPRGNLFVISGPSGAGKGTLISRLVERNPQTWVSVSATTRSPRPGEVDGKDYHFLSEEEFEQILEEDGFLEHALVHGKHYGTLKRYVDEHIAQGDQVILEVDVQGARQVKRIMLMRTIFLSSHHLLRNSSADCVAATRKPKSR